MMSHFKKYSKLYFLLLVVFFVLVLNPNRALADDSLPKTDVLVKPTPPTPEHCAEIHAQYFAALAKPYANAYGTPELLRAQMEACFQAYGGQMNDFIEASNNYWYRRSAQIQQSFEYQVKLAGWGAAMDAISFLTTKFASDAANWILGVDTPDGQSSFFEDSFGDSLKYSADNAAGVFFERFDSQVNEFRANSADQPDTQNSTYFGFTTLCKKPSPLDIQMGIGLGPMGSLNPPTCTLSAMADNFEAIADMVGSGDALNIHKASFTPQGDDLSVGLEVHANYVDAILEAVNAKKLQRQETQGMKPFADKITGKINWPSMMGNESIKNIDPVEMTKIRDDQQADYMFDAYWNTGLEGIGILTLSTFLNRLAFGFLDKLFNPDVYGSGFSEAIDPTKYSIVYNSLMNSDASGDTENYYERQAFAKALGDFIVPNYFTSENKDLTTELSTCPSMRSKWNCSMDQQLAVAINLGTTNGALTIGKASGIGNENSGFTTNNQGLHADWELIPESDIVNNSDPSCYQRAYCAGNLKKLRLARILPVGFEMAANSPYNVKRAGKYSTLGDVIRGFYDCNDEGELDKDHPWCHLINPNWILVAPKYQCRSKGFGDTLMPEIGTRQEECGDVVTCLGTNQKGECTDGYGYCLAERSAYKFDAPECKEQYASCRTYQSSKGDTLSALRYTVERGACSAENIGCTWYATNRYVTSSASPDGLWEGTLNEGARVYLDGGAEPCSSEGCTKVYNVEVGESAFNLIANSSFENLTEVEQNGALTLQGVSDWDTQTTVYQNINTADDSYTGTRGLNINNASGDLEQVVRIYPNRYYNFTYYVNNPDATPNGNIDLQFGNIDETTKQFANSLGTATDISFFEDCTYSGGGLLRLRALKVQAIPNEWQRVTCQFVSPVNSTHLKIMLQAGTADGITFDALQLEEGEYVTDYIEELAELPESHIKIAPDEYKCTGNDDEDHPACANFARVCRQTEVGCQGYTDVNDSTAPEIPATLTVKDYCPKVCSGYGEYRKLASAFDLVYNPVYPEYSDPADDGKAYLIPSTSQSCTLQNVGCEPFTSLEASTAGGEQVAYYDSLRTCEKPNDLSRTYFTWEGSDNEGYVLRTWGLIASSTTDNAPKIVLKGASFGDIKDPNSCDEDLWDSGIDQDCRQFYDETGAVYYAYYSQTVSSDSACTLYRKDDSSEVDCAKTGGHEFVPQSGSCLYYALPSESSVCPATYGGCRAYLGPTGRNAIQTYFQSFADDGSDANFTSGLNSTVARSEESVLVGDYSLKIDSVGGNQIQVQTDIPLITTSTLYRISFWAKSLDSDEVSVTIDGNGIGSFTPTTIWQRFEIGPFEVEDTTSTLAFSAPASLGSLFIDTIKLDQLNDIRFLVKNSGTIPATCDATTEDTPEPRAMLGCNEYVDRDGKQIFARNFSNLCRADSIGCKAFIDTRSVSNPYPESRTITGTPGPSGRVDAEAKAYEEQYLGDWSITSQPWRYYYAIDDSRARCDSSEDSCRAFGKPHFTQDRLSLKTTDYAVDQNDTELLKTQDTIHEFETVLLKHDWDAYYNDDGSLNLACRKDELHCDKFQSGNVTEYFRDPGDHTCEWRDAKQLDANPDIGIYTNGAYGGWFRKGTDMPCYPGNNTESPPKAPYLKAGDNFGAYFTGEDPYSGWVSGCPVDQSECTEFIDPNDSSDQTKPYGRSYFLINSNKLDTHSCGYQADPLAGCVLFNNKSINTLQANSKATYQKSISERGAPQEPIDCKNDPENPYCKVCVNFAFGDTPQGFNGNGPAEILSSLVYNQSNSLTYANQLLEYEKQLQSEGYTCSTDQDCLALGSAIFQEGQAPTNADLGYVSGSCGRENDSNVIVKVKLDRECARWMGCSTAETVFDPAQQKYVNKCNELELCEKNGSRNEDIFCAQFTDRSQESLLQEGQFIDLKSYSARTIEYGSLDYSGYTIPNQYLITDIVSRYVGTDLMTDENLQARYSLDKRLVAEISMDNAYIEEYEDEGSGTGLVCRDFELVDCKSYGCNVYYDDIKSSIGKACTTDNDCYVFEHNLQYTAQGNCGLSLCRDTRSGLIGYQDLINDTCILSVSSPSTMSLVASGQTGGDLSRNANAIYDHYIQENIGNKNTSLQSAMPAPECQLYPEASSPLSNEYVESWKNGTNPPIPEKMISGYEGAKACVYGEDCSCSYRKVRYANGVEQYYSVGGKAPSVGICVGGDMDGQACVPGGYVPVDAQNRVLVSTQQANLLKQNQTCAGGICSAIQDVVVQNGQYGYCLERDKTRIGTSNQQNAPCLTWSPQVVIGGKYDTTHFSPTAGYLPPQGSGEYYCTSGANEQRLESPSTFTRLTGKYWASSAFIAPGYMRQFAFALPNVWDNKTSNKYDSASDIDGNTNGDNSSKLDRIKPINEDDKLMSGNDVQNMGFACRRASLCSGYEVKMSIGDLQYYPERMQVMFDGNNSEGRWIMTGSGPNKSYMEYLIPYAPGLNDIDDKYFDYRYGLFRFSLKPYAAGAACKWNPTWIGQTFPNIDSKSDFSCDSYLQQIKELSDQIYQNLNQGFSGILDRSSEEILVDDQNVPIKLQCTHDSNQSCYYKYWETGYQDNNQQKFIWINTRMKDHTEKFEITQNSQAYFARECSSKNPYFSIRAMFQNVNKIENEMPTEDAKSSKLSGPWQFVGFWVTTCAPTNQTNNPAYLYMNMDFVKGDVCNEVAQVISPATRANAAFTDRVWSQGNFILPTVGVSYDSRNEPFSSALAADKIGKDPMILGVSMPTSGDYSKAPSFVDSGVSVQSLFNEQNAWVPLSNLFAKIYKVYRWSPYLVTKDDWACIKGASMGALCPPNQNKYWGLVHCGDFATCSDELDVDLINQDWRCNSLSGVNRGLGCGEFSLPERNTDPICHNAATFINEDDLPEELYASCNPTDPSKPAKMSFKFDIRLYDKDYNPLNFATDKYIKFQATECQNEEGQFYAVPINPGIANKSWDKSEVLIYGLLKLALKYDVNGKEVGVCQSGSNGRLDDLLVRTLQFPSMKQALRNELASESVNWTGFDDEDIYTNTVLDYAGRWYNLPVNYSLGKWDKYRLGYLKDYSCSADSVNAGHRCKPESNDEFGHSIYCPKKIEACPGGVQDADRYNNDGKPDCGLCVKEDDEYRDLYKVDGVETGHCQYFNDFSRCTTNDDCVFTEFEYWGAYDADNGTPEGESWDDLEGMLPLIHNEDEVLDLNAPDLAMVRLPRPIFPSSEYQNSEKINGARPYAVPGKYSEPAIITNFGGVADIQRDLNNPINIFFGENAPSSDSCKIGSMRLVCDDLESSMRSSIASVESGSSIKVYDNWEKVYNDPSELDNWLGAVFDPVGVINEILTSLGLDFDTSGEHKTAAVAEATAQLILSIANCRMECAAGAFVAPSGYAAHFEEITANTANTDSRSVTIAPFIIDPFYKSIRSMGYQVNKTTGYCEDAKKMNPNSEDKDCCDQEDDFRGDFGRAYFLKGEYFFEHHNWGLARYKEGDDNCGGTDANGSVAGPTDKGTDIFVPDTTEMNGDIVGSVYEKIAKRFWPTLGFKHRFNNTAKDTLLNDELPWDPDKNIYFTKIFPLITKRYRTIDLQTIKIKLAGLKNSLLYFYPINSVWTGFGVSESLLSGLEEYLNTMQKRFELNKAIKDFKDNKIEVQNNAFINTNQKNTLIAEIDSQISEKNKALLDLLAIENEYYDDYQNDLKVNYFNQTGWVTQLSANDKRLKLFPGAVEVAKAKEDKNMEHLFIPGHCEPPKNGTDSDTIKGKIEGVQTADTDTIKAGMPYVVNLYQDHFFTDYYGGISGRDFHGGKVSFDTWFLNAWHPFEGYYDYSYQSTRYAARLEDNYYKTSGQNGYKEALNDKFIEDALWVGASLSIKKNGNDVPIEGPFGDIVFDRTTCRCEGGKFDGQPKSNAKMCNESLAFEENPENFDATASPLDDPSDYCKPVSKADGTPQDYCKVETGTPGHTDPDLDNNWCTHRPGYMPRGDVCADGRVNCLTTYDLTNHLSTNHVSVTNEDPKPKTAPSATDVTSGLDSYKFLSGSYDPYVPGRNHLNNKNFTVYYRPRPPRIAAPDPSRQSSSANTLPVSSLDTFSVDGLANGLAYYGGGQGLSTIRFYAWAMHDQGPIKEIIIDWGDGTHQIIDNAQLKNRKPVCNSTRECEFIEGFACTSDADCPPAGGACLEKGTCKKKVYQTCDSDDDCGDGDECETRMFFGNSTEACQQGYFEFSHVYQCNPQSVLGLVNNDKVCDKTGLCENEPGLTCSTGSDCRPGEECIFNQLAEPDGCYNQLLSRCRYTPRIMVIDNWGWCTGDCSRENEVKPGDTTSLSKSQLIRHPYGGCWDGSNTKINSEVMDLDQTIDPYFGATLPNECKPYFDEVSYFSRSTYQLYRPWIVFDGSVEVSQPNYVEVKPDDLGGFNLFYTHQVNQANSTSLINKFNPL